MAKGYVFEELDKEKILHICQLAANTRDWKDSLDEIVNYSRNYFIFDNIVIYLGEPNTKRVDVFYARATGRGKSSEADVSWGETIANNVIANRSVCLEQATTTDSINRLESPLLIGIPLMIAPEYTGALIFVRFGGPTFTTEGQEFAQFIGTQFTAIIRQKTIDDYEKALSIAQSSSTLQGDFINTMSHELRNPLGFIRGFTTTLLREDTSWGQETQREFLQIIDRETTHLTKLIDDLLDASRLQSGTIHYDFQLIHIDTIIRDEVNRARYAHPNQPITLNFSESLPAIMADPRRLAQVFDNLLENSQKYAPDAEILIKAYANNVAIIIEYSDAGSGIEEKYIPLLFSRFFRVPNTASHIYGTGLGLPICQQIINAHNGDIIASSEFGSGLNFTIILPLNEEGKN
ncbi:MAG: HAMP domain-containing histidine kinase [Anaerolineaceae bacterium]|nr:HAMP domain-containing histidine kinase [Anaerolineaceae bacterium]